MKKRYIYSILFGIPGLIVSGIFSLVVSGFTAGFLWIFIFGDNPWPTSIEKILPVFLALVFLIGWFLSVSIGYTVGKRLEQNPVQNKKHILVSMGITFLLILLILSYQVSVGNIGPKSESIRCSEYCSRAGYSASSVSPKNSGDQKCSCLDDLGQVKLDILIETLDRLK